MTKKMVYIVEGGTLHIPIPGSNSNEVMCSTKMPSSVSAVVAEQGDPQVCPGCVLIQGGYF